MPGYSLRQACGAARATARTSDKSTVTQPLVGRRQAALILSTVAVSVLQARTAQAVGLPSTCPDTTARPASSRRSSYYTMASADAPREVLVTGAGGKTGKIILSKLLALPDQYKARGLFHSDASAQKAQKESGLPEDQSFIGDITDESSPGLARAVEGADALVIATSAAPKLIITSLPKVIWRKITGGSAFPDFYYTQMPEQVDWIGQKHQIDAALKAGVKKVVVISSMGGTDPDNVLNKMGGGNILVYKRKAEEYLISNSQLDHTIIHPGGLTDDAGGERELVIGVDDELMKSENRRIPRADVAELCVQSLSLLEASNRSIDVISKPPPGHTDFKALLSGMTKNCRYDLASQS